MPDTSEQSLLLALDTHEELFEKINSLLTSENYLRVLMVVEEGKLRKQMAEEAGVSTGTVSNAIAELQEFGLVEETDEGYQRTLPVLGHPIVQHLFWEEAVDDA
ncbi:MarR family transcriptional regulator [Halosimplex marinum]|uniref:MarR family transcriptional regulator n=1 Tax=Halosimplex marinum TaxID=3396620 RepID=UPI003F56CB3F